MSHHDGVASSLGSLQDSILNVFICKAGGRSGKKGGARDLRKVIRQSVEAPLCTMLVELGEAAPTVIRVAAENGEIRLMSL